MTVCKKCGGPITFRKLPSGKSMPVEVDGSEHWDICKRRKLEQLSPAQREQLLAAKPPLTTATTATHVYCGELPPWDDSLGEFRDFTPEEKAAGLLCRPV